MWIYIARNCIHL